MNDFEKWFQSYGENVTVEDGNAYANCRDGFKAGMLAAAEIAKDGYGEVGILVSIEIENKAEEL